MFKTGDKVVVVNRGKCYSTTKALENVMGLISYEYGREIGDDRVSGWFVIVAMSYVPGTHDIAYGIEDQNGDQFIIGGDGLKKYEEPKPITEEELVKLWTENDYRLVFIGPKAQRVMNGYEKGSDYPFELGGVNDSYEVLLENYTHYWTKSTEKQPLK